MKSVVASASFTRRIALSLGLALALGLVGAEGCQSSEVRLCGAVCDCEGCSDVRRQTCEDQSTADGRAAANAGCPDLYDALVSCQNATATCVGTTLETSCKQESDRLDNCLGPVKIKR